jgi:hypothetical protein
MPKDLSAKTIEHLEPGPSRREMPDAKVRGLHLIIEPSDHRSWAYRYRFGGITLK